MRFNYVKYDENSTSLSEAIKDTCESLESKLGLLEDGREKALALTKLEEVFMWVGKSIRNSQIKRDSQPAHLPERDNS